MHFTTIVYSLSMGCAALANARGTKPKCEDPYVGYLLSTFTDIAPEVFMYLSTADAPLDFTKLNGGDSILQARVGMNATRDVFLTTNSARSEYFIIATDLNVKIDDFSWDWANRHGSRNLVISRSTDLVHWSEPVLSLIEDDTAGMAWAPSAIWNEEEQQYYVFWAARLYVETDPDHTGTGTPELIRYTTTKDFETFAKPEVYASAAEGIIDQEFYYLGTPDHWVRWLKDNPRGRVYQETTTDGIFGNWTNDTKAVAELGSEGAAHFQDIKNPETHYLLLDNFTEYIPFITDDILSNNWTETTSPDYPRGLKHGSVFRVTRSEYEAIAAAYL